MTHYLNLRSPAGVTPDVLRGNGLAEPPRMAVVPLTQLPGLVAGRDLLMGAHGFNVSYADGLRSLGRLDGALSLPSDAIFFGVLWPGDFWIPVVNYPFEASDAVRCGKLLAQFCDRYFVNARSLSFMSHSLGGRLALEAVRHTNLRVKSVCLTAAAVDRDVLTASYHDAIDKAEALYVLSSRRDRVLRYAYPAGDFLSDIFGDSDSPFRSALGLRGPNPIAGPKVTPSEIPDNLNCDHGHYLSTSPIAMDVAGYISRAFKSEAQTWPQQQ